MTWVKVCGLTTRHDIAVVIDAGADAVGFVNIATSPRYVPLERAAELAAEVPVHTFLLTKDADPDRTIEYLQLTGIDGVQPYGSQAAELAATAVAAGYLVLYPRHAEADLDLSSLPGIPLVDTPSATHLGGTGKVFDWGLVESLEGRFVLAGGLGPDNVATAVERIAPWGVDASSRLESAPGRKDPVMVAAFIEKAKQT